MPTQSPHTVGLAFELHGCPNCCRHCYLGRPSGSPLSLERVRDIVAQFREYRRPDELIPLSRDLKVFTWIWEPDYSDDYRSLYELECELSDGGGRRFELLSVWRLARDESYAAWAGEVGPTACQITFFGTEETNDWFYRRKGAFRDCLMATERLLAVGMKPRWQLFLTRRILPELGDLMRLVDQLRLRERVQELGGELDMFLHTPGPDGEARYLEHLRPTLDEVEDGAIPAELLAASRKHFGRETLWNTEAELIAEIMAENDELPYGLWPADPLCFFIRNDLGVYTNLGPMEPGWKLGNLGADSVASVVDSFVNNRPLAYATAHSIPVRQLVQRYGSSTSTRIYADAGDLKSLFLARHCRQMCERRGANGTMA